MGKEGKYTENTFKILHYLCYFIHNVNEKTNKIHKLNIKKEYKYKHKN